MVVGSYLSEFAGGPDGDHRQRNSRSGGNSGRHLTNSQDVIHSFWAPNITGKRDLLPGYSSAFSFEIDEAGIYHGQCAEFCGLQHAHMGFSIIAESVDKFQAWQQQQLKAAAEPVELPKRFAAGSLSTHACLMCHTIRGTDAGSRFGPDLTHVASRNMIAAETLPNTAGALAGWVRRSATH